MRIAIVLCLAALVVPLAACSRDADGTLAGEVQIFGGPAVNGKQALNGEPGRNWPVAVSSGGKVVATTRSDGSGRFTFSLPPGTYSVGCAAPQMVTIRSEVVTNVSCMASVP